MVLATPHEEARPARLVIFTDLRTSFAGELVRAALEAARGAPGLRVVAVCETSRIGWPRAVRRDLRNRIVWWLRRFSNPGEAVPRPRGRLALLRLCRRHGCRLLAAPRGGVNDEAFVAALRELRPTLALSLGCLARLGRKLLATFEAAVNYHNGRLPGTRGLRATGWSIYLGEASSGFTYHRMTRRIDEGPVLLAGEVPIPAGSTSAGVEAEKAAAAARRLPEVLERLLRREPGRPQVGEARFFGRQDAARVMKVPDPGACSPEELELRLRAFGRLRVAVAGRWWPVTALRACARGETPDLIAAGGRGMRVTRLDGLPRFVFRLLAFRRRRRRGRATLPG